MQLLVLTFLGNSGKIATICDMSVEQGQYMLETAQRGNHLLGDFCGDNIEPAWELLYESTA